jgi:hypothetical protein
MQTSTDLKSPTLSNYTPKSILTSKTFWGAVFTAVIAIAPTVGNAVKAKELTVDDTVKLVMLLATTGLTITGRVQAKEAVFTPKGIPGPNRSDFDQPNS